MYTIGSFLREEELTGLKLMTDTADLQAEITNINIIDNPDSYDLAFLWGFFADHRLFSSG